MSTTEPAPNADSVLGELNKGCKCEWEERPLGRLDGVSMGRGMVRITTHPHCPVHGGKR